MLLKKILYILFVIVAVVKISMTIHGCAQIGMPTGGPRDSLPPRLVNAVPAINTTNFSNNKITLTFDEYIEVKDVQNNVLVSPFQKTSPLIDYKLKTVTIKLRDTLLPNTTYTIHLGNAIVDIHEGNVLKDFTYVFSTGNFIDSLSLTGKVIIAETGKTDSTLIAMLYRNADDSAVRKRKPDYIARLNNTGNFYFNNLPPGNFKIYALKDGDGGKTYNSKTELFAFADSIVTVSNSNLPIVLYASALEKDTRNFPATTVTRAADKKLKYTPSSISQDLTGNFILEFNNPIKTFDGSKIFLTDTNFTLIPATLINTDSTRRKLIISAQWKENTDYRLVLQQNAVTDSADNSIAKIDTLAFTTKKESDYGNVVLRFSNIDLTKHPVLQFVQNDVVKESYPLTTMEWNKKLFSPGEYEIRILYDDNNNGKWDPGNYSLFLQPEKVISLSQKLSVRANWDNEQDIRL